MSVAKAALPLAHRWMAVVRSLCNHIGDIGPRGQALSISVGDTRPSLRAVPTRWSTAVFEAKVAVLRLRRGIRNIGAAAGQRLPRQAHACSGLAVAMARSPLWSDLLVAESQHQLGKVQNLRRAAAILDGVVIPGGRVFSFWRQLGRASRARGFVAGRMLQQGCVVPAVGGGLCQLSNALYDVALQAGCEIVERHAHSRRVPGSAAAQGRDATVAWNYVDLRFRPVRTVRLSVRLTADELVVGLHGEAGRERARPDAPGGDDRALAQSCDACAQTGCFRHGRVPWGGAGRQAILVDEAWPEFIRHLAGLRQGHGSIGVPLPDIPGRPARYAWATAGFAHVGTAGTATLRRSLALRRATPGAGQRRAEADGAARMARGLAPLLTAEVTSLWVAQSYLPTLWRDGHLGGRRFSVLMTRLPMHALQARLDAAFAAHPGRATLADFRADPDLVRWEAEALAQADAVATPHSEIAALFPGRVVHLEWCLPSPAIPTREGAAPWRIAFPGPTLARKGAYEVRAAARSLGLEVLLLGADLEGPGFWDGVRTSRPDPASPPFGWLRDVMAVVQPALVEQQPRRLLAALAAGVPVLASPACGLDGLVIIPVAPLDAAGLMDRLASMRPG